MLDQGLWTPAGTLHPQAAFLRSWGKLGKANIAVFKQSVNSDDGKMRPTGHTAGQLGTIPGRRVC